jgi:hypothetical protein
VSEDPATEPGRRLGDTVECHGCREASLRIELALQPKERPPLSGSPWSRTKIVGSIASALVGSDDARPPLKARMRVSTCVPFEEVAVSDLVVGTVYRGGQSGALADEPLDRMFHCGNMGGFRSREVSRGTTPCHPVHDIW